MAPKHLIENPPPVSSSDEHSNRDLDSTLPSPSAFILKPKPNKYEKSIAADESPSSKKNMKKKKKKKKKKTKKSVLRRLWSEEEDETVILKGTMEKGEKGQDPVFSYIRVHEHNFFELSKKANNNNAANAKQNDKVSGVNGGGLGIILGLPCKECSVQRKKKEKVVTVKESLKSKEKVEVVGDDAGGGGNGKRLNVNDDKNDYFIGRLKSKENVKAVGDGCLEIGEGFLWDNMSMIGSEKAKELRLKWNQLRIDELEFFIKRTELVKENAALVLDALNSSLS